MSNIPGYFGPNYFDKICMKMNIILKNKNAKSQLKKEKVNKNLFMINSKHKKTKEDRHRNN